MRRVTRPLLVKTRAVCKSCGARFECTIPYKSAKAHVNVLPKCPVCRSVNLAIKEG